jgi:hypothetical protein
MRTTVALLVSLCGCRGAEQPSWAALHGTVREVDAGLEGHLVWELFDKKWARRHDADRHICSRVQRVVAVPDASPEGCAACTVWAVRTEELDTDCVAPWDTDASLAGPTHMGIGPVTEDLGGVGAFPDESDGWYLSWDGEALEPHGVAHDEALDLSAAVAATRSETAWVLTPATAWRVEQ